VGNGADGLRVSETKAKGTIFVIVYRRLVARLARLWQATNVKARDFRLETLVKMDDDGVVAGGTEYLDRTDQRAADGMDAGFAELAFASGRRFRSPSRLRLS
jgi:hypothetical protein